MLIMAEHSWFQEWEATTTGKRGQDYLNLKQQWQERCFSLLYRFYPQFKSKVEFLGNSCFSSQMRITKLNRLLLV